MKKLKLLFPLFATSALAVTPALTAQSNTTHKSNVGGLKESWEHYRNSTDNNKLLFLNGLTKEYYYGGDGSPGGNRGANLDFTFTSYGATLLAKAETLTTHSTGAMIMYFLDKNLKHFDNGVKDSYLNEIEGVVHNYMYQNQDHDAYSKFADSMSQPASVVDKITDMFRKGEKLPQVNVWFHYYWHPIESNTFDVLFGIVK